jgi:L,D-peptidoglycan transpeptidase YkuD (ErfK/YbiS/YcfS/YnhG family)
MIAEPATLLTRRTLLQAGGSAALAGLAAVRPADAKVVHDLYVRSNGVASIAGLSFRCAVGRGGVCARKREGDGATPLGSWPLRNVLFRPDRLARPATALPAAPLQPADGWCDAPADPNYNRMVRHPYPASAERLWRKDAIYDLIVVVGYNDQPVIPGRGSAIFLHVARPDYTPTAGCVAFARQDLLQVLGLVTASSRLIVSA